MPSHKRKDVYKAIDGERAYQDRVIDKNLKRHDASLPDHSVGDYLTMLTTYLHEAHENWTRHGGNHAALDSIRKIGAIAVHCMEDHGAPEREAPHSGGYYQG